MATPLEKAHERATSLHSDRRGEFDAKYNASVRLTDMAQDAYWVGHFAGECSAYAEALKGERQRPKLYAVSAHLVHENADKSTSIHQLPSFLLSDVQAEDIQAAKRLAIDIITNHPAPDAANTYHIEVAAL